MSMLSFPPARRAWYIVGVLLLAYVSSMIDRVILGYLVGPIKTTFGVSDSHLSVLMGIAFTLFYSVLGIPAGQLADNLERRKVVAVGVALWSLATMYCGIAKTYVQLFIGRAAVGVGEATLSPSAYSLIADVFPPEKRTTAMSVYSMGIAVGNGSAVMLAGGIAGFAASAGVLSLPIVGDIHAWQFIFLLVGAPGLLISLLFFTFKEPARLGVENKRAVRIFDVAAYLKQHKKAALCHTVGFGLFSIFNQGVGFWFPEFFIRTYGWERPQIGVWQGSTSIVFGALGLWAGSRLAAYFFRKGRTDANMLVMLTAAACLMPVAAFMPHLPTGAAAALCFVWTGFFGFMPYGAAPAAIQQLMPNQMRGQAGALFLLVINIMGGGTGPLIVSSITDFVFQNDAALRYSMSIVAVVSLTGASVLYVVGLKAFRQSVGEVSASFAKLKFR